jgi:hypothetical protein
MESFMFSKTIKAFAWNGSIPKLQRVRLEFERSHIHDIAAAVIQEMDQVESLGQQLRGKSVAITAGSRGIDRIDQILAALVRRLRVWGAQPFIVPAMGSHGGATAEGQLSMLAEFGITEASVGAPIRSSMETVELGRLPNGMPVYMDRHAASADAIVVVNRVKPHTDFSGEFESGLAKMAVIGLGKLHGADTLHRFGVPGLRDFVPEAAHLVCQKAPIIFGLATVENAYHQAAHIALVTPEGIAGPQERELLKLAYQLMPRFPFPEIDVLIVDEIGKNISGVGMDPKVIGRVKVHGIADMTACDIRTIAVLRLTAESHGNATGVGLADVTTQRLVSQIDFETTYLNCITSGILGIQRAAIPVVAPTDQAAIETALRVCGRPDVQNARVVRIKNTLSLGEMDVTPGLLAEALPGISITPVGESFDLPFDEEGNLAGF